MCLCRAFHRCKAKEKMVVEPTSARTKVADNIVTTRRGFRAVSRTDPENIYCHPVVVQPVDTAELGLPLPWVCGVGAARYISKESARIICKTPDTHRYVDIDYSRSLKVARSAVLGKAILCGGVLTEWRKDWLYGSKKDY